MQARTTVITGSASGMGAAVRTRLEKSGDKVIGIDLRDAEIIADLSTEEGCATAIAGVKQRCGDSLDCFVAVAGVSPDVKNPSLIASVNYYGVVRLLDGLFELLKKGSNPAAVVFSSNSAQMAPVDDNPYVLALLNSDRMEAMHKISEIDHPGMAYMFSKNAVARAVRHRAAAWGNAGVRLNVICPGTIKTPMQQRLLNDPTTSGSINTLNKPLGRFGEPEEVAAVAAFLLGPEASYVHGAVYYVDGGEDAQIRPDRF
ncbi:SDR family oxidoreductase [Chloroflexota bacterium]